MQFNVHSPFEDAFALGTRFAGEQGDIIEMTVRTIGELKMPTGRVIVCDPFTSLLDASHAVLARVAPIGVFPVDVAIARFENEDRRVACARIRFTEHPKPTRWEVALFEDQDSRRGDAIPGYHVDSGFGSFCDKTALHGLNEVLLDEWLAATKANEVTTWTWHVAEAGQANVAMISSGWGDGFYGTFWGIDARGETVELVTDFRVLLGTASKSFEVPLPLSPFSLYHPLLKEYAIKLRGALFSRTTAVMSGQGSARVELSSGIPVEMRRQGRKRLYTWPSSAPDERLVVRVMTGVRQLGKI